MAENKKKVIVYADWIDKFEELEDDEAGRLIKHFFRYINDQNPEAPDRTTKLMFIDIKNTLKRDLDKWEEKSPERVEKARVAGLASAEARKLKKELNSTNELKNQLNSTKSTVSVSVTDSVNVSDTIVLLKKEPKANFNFKRNLIDLGLKENLVDDWLKVRKTKKLTNTETAFNNLKIEFDKSGKDITEIINHCVTQSWGGFKAAWKWEDSNSNQTSQPNNSGNLIHTN